MLIPSQIRRPNALGYALTALVIVLLGIVSSAYVYTQVDTAGREHIKDRAQTVAEMLSKEDVMDLSGKSSDIDTSSYERIKSILTRIRQVNSDVRFAYLVGVHPNGDIFFYADSEDPSSEDYSPPGQEYEEAPPAMRGMFDTGIPVTEGPVRDRWGVWVSAYAPVRDDGGRIIALLGLDLPASEFITDVVAYSLLPLLVALVLLVLLTAAERLHAREYRSVGQKAEFLSIASHEIRTPLTGIRWAVESMLSNRTNPVTGDTKTTLERVHESCLMLIARINNLLDVTAFESRGVSVLKKSDIEIPSFVEEIVESLALSAMQRQVRIVIDPSVRDAGTFTADPQTMHHVFFNLIANAVKYTNPNTEVRIQYERSPRMHVFSFVDHGPGMSAHDQAHIFEGYHRTEAAVRSGQYGSGLGLYLARTAANLHGGSVDVLSTVGEGARFTLTIPT